MLKKEVVVLVELGLMEQRYKAVLEVLNDGPTVIDAARRYGVGRQAVHSWQQRKRPKAWAARRWQRPPGHLSTPEAPAVEARVLDLRRFYPSWGPRTILTGSSERVSSRSRGAARPPGLGALSPHRSSKRSRCPILTDNGKVFTGRFGPGHGTVLFDRICQENGTRHLVTASRSPTTTSKVERFRKTLKKEFLGGQIFDSIEDAQAQIDARVHEDNSTPRTPERRGPAAGRALRLARPERLESSTDPSPASAALAPRFMRRMRTMAWSAR